MQRFLLRAAMACVMVAAASAQEADRLLAPVERTPSALSSPLFPRETPVPKPEWLPDALVGRARSTPAVVRRGLFNSVQVNVDADGMNILHDAANEPSIAVDPTHPNRMVIGWRQFNTIASNFRQAGYAYTTDGGRTWTFPGVIEPGIFRSDPVLGADSSGVFYYLSIPGITSQQIFRSLDGGKTWLQRVPAFGGDKPWLAISGGGGACQPPNLFISWNAFAGCCGNRIYTQSAGGSTFITPLPLPLSPIFGTLTLGPAGELYIAGVSATGPGFPGPITVVRSTNAGSPTSTPTFPRSVFVNLGGRMVLGAGPNPGGLLGQVWIATDHSHTLNHGAVYVLASVDPIGPDPLDVMFVRSLDGGATWSLPVRVNQDSRQNRAWQWFGTMSVAPNGRIDAIWNDTRIDPNNIMSQLFYSFSSDGGATWSTNTVLTPAFNSLVGFPQQNKMGDYYHMVSDDVGASLAFAATFNGEQDVYFIRIGDYDCNVNGVSDQLDILNGTSLDDNADGVPDECQTPVPVIVDCNVNGVPDSCEPDCNGNGSPDDCDIASGFSQDFNGNGVPDECEPDLCIADLNGDRVVNEGDLSVMIGRWQSSYQPADFNSDGVVSVFDLAFLVGSWGACP